MANEYQDYLASTQANQQMRTGVQQQTLRDLQIQREMQALAPGSLEQLTRQLQAQQVQGSLENLPQQLALEQQQLGTQQVQADTQATEARINQSLTKIRAGGNPHDELRTLVDEGVVPAGTELERQPIGPGKTKVWAIRNKDVPGHEDWLPLDPDVEPATRKVASEQAMEKYKSDLRLEVDGYQWQGDSLTVIPGGPADPKNIKKTGLTNIQKLHMYRQSLEDSRSEENDQQKRKAIDKLISEVEGQINSPETSSKIMGGMLRKVINGEPLDDNEIKALDTYKFYQNPMAQVISDAISQQEGSLKERLQTPGKGKGTEEEIVDLTL